MVAAPPSGGRNRNGRSTAPSHHPSVPRETTPSRRGAKGCPMSWLGEAVWTKACPRCTGDLVRVVDDGDRYISCVQCGYVSYAAAPPRPAIGTQRVA